MELCSDSEDVRDAPRIVFATLCEWLASCVGSDGRCNTIWYKAVFKGGVYEAREKVWLSAAQKSEVWRRWKAGQTLHEIGRAFGKEHSSIRCLVSRHGGIVPAVRRRALLALTLREREEISRGLASGSSIREIAKCLDRTVSTVSPGGRTAWWPSCVSSQSSGRRSLESALRPKRCLLSIHVKLRNIVASKLILDWSPEQISGWLKIQYPDDESMRVSHEPFTEACSFKRAEC